MIKSLRELLSLLTARQRRRFFRLQLLVILMSGAEIAGVLSIGPFMSLVGNPEQLAGSGLMAQLYVASGVETPRIFMMLMGFLALAALALSAVISMLTLWRLALFGSQTGAELGARLYQHFLYRDWEFHASHSSSTLTNLISRECERVTTGVIYPLMTMNAKLAMASFMSIAIFLYDPVVALFAVLIFVGGYFVIFKTVRIRLLRYGRNVSRANQARFKLMSEGFGGIRDLLLLGRQAGYTRAYDRESDIYAKSHGTALAMARVPGALMELVAFGSVIGLVLYLLGSYNGNLGAVLPALSVYALAGFKVLPAMQVVYSGLTQVRTNLPAFESIRPHLQASRDIGVDVAADGASGSPMMPRQSVTLNDVSYTYPEASSPALSRVNMVFPANQTTGIRGESGAGKSTLLDIFVGLIQPETGCIKVDGEEIQGDRMNLWRQSIGVVHQDIFLSDGSVSENIAFGIAAEEIDHHRVEECIDSAQLRETIARLPEGKDTLVGERGVRLSGGQRQRIGIARALYHGAHILVFDEATSALDTETESQVMASIDGLAGSLTIVIVAHRESTLSKCSQVYTVSGGRVSERSRETIGA